MQPLSKISGGMLGGWAVARIMKTHAAATGLNPDHYSGHSPRAGSCPNVTAAAAAPAPYELPNTRPTRY